MNANSFLSPKLLAGAAIVGIVGAAGVFIYEQVYAEKRRAMLVTEVQRLDKQMASMRIELETLRELQKESQLKRQQRQKRTRRAAPPRAAGDVPDGPSGPAGAGAPADNTYASDSEYFTDYQSVLGTDAEMDSEEFYDVHTDDDDDTLRDTLNGHAITDRVFDEDLSDKVDKSPKSSPRRGT